MFASAGTGRWGGGRSLSLISSLENRGLFYPQSELFCEQSGRIFRETNVLGVWFYFPGIVLEAAVGHHSGH